MAEATKEETKKEEKKASKSNGKKSQPNILILFKVKADAAWAVYPRLFNDEETAITKLEQSYPFTDHCFQPCDFK